MTKNGNWKPNGMSREEWAARVAATAAKMAAYEAEQKKIDEIVAANRAD